MSNSFYMGYCSEVTTIVDRIRAERKSLGFSQELFAEKCGIHRGTVADIERGKQSPSLETLFAIAKATGKPMEYFITGEYPKPVLAEVHQVAAYVEDTIAGLGEMARLLRKLGGKPADLYRVDNMKAEDFRGAQLAADKGLSKMKPTIAEQAQEHLDNTPDEPVNPGEDDEGTDLGDSSRDGG